MFLTDFIEVFLCKSISANVEDLQYFAISIFQEFNQAMQRTGFSLVRDIKSDVNFLADD